MMALPTIAWAATQLIAQEPAADELVYDGQEPWPCPASLNHHIDVDGIRFNNVPFTMTANHGRNIASYRVNGIPVSADGRWQWIEGTVTLSCYIYWVWRGPVRLGLRTYFSHGTGGSLIPVQEGSGDCGGDGSGEPMTVRATERAPTRSRLPRPSLASCDSPGSWGGWGSDAGNGCTWRYGVIEISFDGGMTWHVWWQGWYVDCAAS